MATGARVDIVTDQPYVSRGGAKLERALEVFGWQVLDLRCLDVGASTGGFTDCLLARGAASVTAMDVGYGQLAWKLRTDPRVRVIERSNFRHADPAQNGAPYDFICIDVSFISLTKLASQLRTFLGTDGRVVALIKPQFESGRAQVGKGGVVREPAVQAHAIESVVHAFAEAGLAATHLTYSPIKGPAGNIEFLLGAQAGALAAALDAAGVVRAAHESLDR